MAHAVILYELNEVPWRVIDWYVGKRPRSHIAKLLSASKTYTSVTRDQGELHPWTTWPTLHRGVYNFDHNICFLNQDLTCAEAWPPVWERAARAGKRVGVFGSLQSYPVPETPSYEFYIPDTFAPAPETSPSRYEAYQRFNLRQTKQDGAVANDIRLGSSTLNDLLGMAVNGLTAQTAILLLNQVFLEQYKPLYRTRRSTLQAPVAFDIFKHAIRRSNPDFCTFFTNHVAGTMHRYWKFIFPEDFGYSIKGPDDRIRASNVLWAMDLANAQIGWLRRYVDHRGATLVVASSMGQEAVHRDAVEGEPRVVDADRFVRALGFRGPFKQHLAMQPDFNFEFDDDVAAAEFQRIASNAEAAPGVPLFFRIRSAGRTVNCGLSGPAEMMRSRCFVSNGRAVSFEEAGVDVIERDIGTGYHQPKGILLWYDRGAPAENRVEIESTAIAGMLLDELGLGTNSMQGDARSAA